MGKAVGQGGALMDPGPSKGAEALVAIFVPPACREEVLGDLHERYRSPSQYIWDAACTVPLVIMSRIRRTADPQVLLMQVFALYVSFLGAAWFTNRALLREQWGLMRLAIPAAIAMLGPLLEDAYASPGRRSPLKLVRGPVIGVGLALVSQGMLQAGDSDLALPRWMLFYGCAMSLLLSSAVRLLFPPVADQLQGANAPALWLKRAGGSDGTTKAMAIVFKGVATLVAAAIAGTWIADHFSVPLPRALTSLLLLVIAYQFWKRG
jgi:hypothetical protein